MERIQFYVVRDAYFHQKEQRTIYDNKASFLIGISGVIFAFSMGRIDQLGFFVISLSSLVSLILSVWTVSFPFPRGRGAKFSLLSWSGFRALKKDDYEKQIKDVINSDDKIIHEYVREIYALYKYSVLPKSKMVRSASIILTFSLVIGLFLLILGV